MPPDQIGIPKFNSSDSELSTSCLQLFQRRSEQSEPYANKSRTMIAFCRSAANLNQSQPEASMADISTNLNQPQQPQKKGPTLERMGPSS